VAYILPFRWMLGFPVELLLGRLTPTEAVVGLGVQVLWVALAYVLMRLVWRAGIRLYSAVGA
jgi:ABC-2 type transport system permease protein